MKVDDEALTSLNTRNSKQLEVDSVRGSISFDQIIDDYYDAAMQTANFCEKEEITSNNSNNFEQPANNIHILIDN